MVRHVVQVQVREALATPTPAPTAPRLPRAPRHPRSGASSASGASARRPGRMGYQDYTRAVDSQLHRNRLRSMRAAVDTASPPRYKHLRQKLKQLQAEAEREASIRRENELQASRLKSMPSISVGEPVPNMRQSQQVWAWPSLPPRPPPPRPQSHLPRNTPRPLRGWAQECS
jgi:hypothetical protein